MANDEPNIIETPEDVRELFGFEADWDEPIHPGFREDGESHSDAKDRLLGF